MTPDDAALSDDARYIQGTARLFGWEVAWEPDGSARASRGDQTVRICFTRDGAFWFGRATGPRTTDQELALAQTVQTLERHGRDPLMPAEAA